MAAFGVSTRAVSPTGYPGDLSKPIQARRRRIGASQSYSTGRATVKWPTAARCGLSIVESGAILCASEWRNRGLRWLEHLKQLGIYSFAAGLLSWITLCLSESLVDLLVPYSPGIGGDLMRRRFTAEFCFVIVAPAFLAITACLGGTIALGAIVATARHQPLSKPLVGLTIIGILSGEAYLFFFCILLVLISRMSF
jgi:hypothetical protein